MNHHSHHEFHQCETISFCRSVLFAPLGEAESAERREKGRAHGVGQRGAWFFGDRLHGVSWGQTGRGPNQIMFLIYEAGIILSADVFSG